jgi:hypothetical protein
MKTSLVLAFCAVLLLASPARAWNCSDPLAARVPVPTGTTGSFGDGDGQLFMGTGTEGVKGQLYECKVPTTTPNPPKTKGAPIYQNQSQTTSVNDTQNTSNQNSSSSGSSSKSSSNASSTNNNLTSNNNSLTASPISNATASGGASSSTSTYDSETNVAASRIPVQTAVGLAPPPTVPCAIGFGVGAQTMAFGISGSGAKIDKNCAGLETARSFAAAGSRIAYCKVMVNQKFAKAAGVTMADCMTLPVVSQIIPVAPVVAAPAPMTPQPQPVIIQVPVPQPVAAVQSTGSLQDLGSFKVTRSYSTNLCPTVQTILGPGGVQILNKAITLSDGGEVILIGNVYTTAVATNYLRKHGVNKVVIRAADEQDSSVAVQIWSVK